MTTIWKLSRTMNRWWCNGKSKHRCWERRFNLWRASWSSTRIEQRS
jgi:hypothetical protein